MNVVVLHGSPRKGMNSDTLADQFLSGLHEQGEHKVTHFYTNEMEIKPCQGCLHCATSPGHACAIDDDMTEIYAAYKGSDLVVWATPMYWGYMTAQMKAVLDRMEALAWEGFEDRPSPYSSRTATTTSRPRASSRGLPPTSASSST